MIARVATAVTIEITGAMAIIHGTAVSGVDASFESSFSTSAAGCRRPFGPTRFGPTRDWKRPSSFRSAHRMMGTIRRTKAKITIAFTIRTTVLSRPVSIRTATAWRFLISTGPSREAPAATGRRCRRHAGAHDRGCAHPLVVHGQLDLVAALDAEARARPRRRAGPPVPWERGSEVRASAPRPGRSRACVRSRARIRPQPAAAAPAARWRAPPRGRRRRRRGPASARRRRRSRRASGRRRRGRRRQSIR